MNKTSIINKIKVAVKFLTYAAIIRSILNFSIDQIENFENLKSGKNE